VPKIPSVTEAIRRPENAKQSERHEAGRYPSYMRPVPSTNANTTGGRRTGPITMPAIMPETSPGGSRLQAYHRTPPRRRFARSWIPSGTHAPSARRRDGGHLRGYFLRARRFSTFLRTLPTFLTAFFTAGAERPDFLAS
jgi:hypothetical protein